jgi:hypothetical protein
MYLKIPGVTGIDRHEISRRSPQYPEIGTFFHIESLTASENVSKAPEALAIGRDLIDWEKRRVREYFWMALYQLIGSYRSESASSGNKEDMKIENAPFMHIEAYSLSPEEQDKYYSWFCEYGLNGFIPLFVKLPGLKGYDFLKGKGVKTRLAVRESEYPAYLSIIYFENIQAFENFENSKELAMFQKIMRNVFPHGLNYKWYAQYKLVQSWRK